MMTAPSSGSFPTMFEVGWKSKYPPIMDCRAQFCTTDCVFQIGNYLVEVRDGIERFEVLIAHIDEPNACFRRMVKGRNKVIPTITHALKSLGVKS